MCSPGIPFCLVSFVYHTSPATEPLEGEGFTTMKRSWLPKFLQRQQAITNVSSRKPPRPRTFHPRLEQLEDRTAPAVITVTTTADDNVANDGSVSLREAIQAINNGSGGLDMDITNQLPGVF